MARRDLRHALDDEPDDDAPSWKPEIGDEIIGRIVRRDQIANKFKPDVPTERLVLETEDGDLRTIYANHAVLRNKIQKLDPRVGDRIAIRREPDVADKQYVPYKVVVDRAGDQATPIDPNDDIPF